MSINIFNYPLFQVSRLLKCRVLSYLLLVVLIYRLNISVADDATNEYEVKAAFLYNLARMVDWPNEDDLDRDSPFIWCFLGEDYFENALDSIKDKPVKKHSLLIKKDILLSEVNQCQLLFISKSEKKNFSRILSVVERLPILTVGDIDGFVEQGGMVTLMEDEQRIQIQVNLAAVEAAKLKVSSRLLSLADIVE